MVKILSIIAELLGLAAIVWGISLFNIPAAVIVGGCLLVLVGMALDPPVRVPKGLKQ